MTAGPADGPSRTWYWVGGAVALVGIVATIVWVVTGIRAFTRQVDDFQRLDVGDEAPVTFDEPGGYTIYYEAPDADLDNTDVNVTMRGPGVNRGSIDEYDGELTYTVDGREGRAVLTVHIDEAGTFRVRATSPGDDVGQIAIGRSLAPQLVRTVVGGILLGLYTVGGAAGIILVTALRRRDARRRTALPLIG